MAETLTNTNGPIILKQSTLFNRAFYFGTTSQTVTVKLSKNSGAWATAAGAVTEIGGAGNGLGWYSVALTVVDTNNSGALGSLGQLAYNCTAASGGPVDFTDVVQTTVFTDLLMDSGGRVFITASVKQSQPVTIPFVMTVGNPPQATPGLTVTAQRTLGGSGYALCTNSNTITDLGGGTYALNLSTTDTAIAGFILLKLTAPGANDLYMELTTQP